MWRNQMYWYFKWKTEEIAHKMIWKWLRGNLKSETEFWLMAAQNNAIRINYVKVKTDNMQNNSKCRLCADRNEMFNHTMSKCSKLSKKNTRLDMTGWER